jgi:hypothetical protein
VLRRLLPALAVLLAVPATAAAQAVAPTATTGAPEAVGQTTATFVAQVVPGDADTTVRFEYGTTDALGLQTAERSVPAGAAPAEVRVGVTGLTAGTTYRVRVVATSAAGTATGAVRTFTTDAAPPAPRAPAVRTGGVRDVTASSATLTGSVDPNGQATTAHFDFGTTERLGQRTADQAVGRGDGARTVTAAIGGLATYDRVFFRVVATSAAGTVRGAVRSFVTQRALGPFALALNPTAPVWGQGVGVAGRLTGAGVRDASVVLEQDPHPFGDGWREVGRQTTRSDGSFAFAVPPLFQRTLLRVRTRTTPPVTSAVAVASTRRRVGLLPARRTARGSRVARFAGRVWPPVPGARASLQRRRADGRWVPVARGPVAVREGRARYALRGRVPAAGATFRVVVTPADRTAHARGTSRERAVAFRSS